MALTADLVDDVAALAPYRAAWDALAMAAGRPYCQPGWMLSWWEEVAAEGSRLAVVVVRDGDEVVGIGPFWADDARRRIGLLAERTSAPVEPLARPDAVHAVASACAELLAGREPAPAQVVFQYAPGRSPWPRLVLDEWPGDGERSLRHTRAMRVPRAALADEDLDAWLARRSRNFRQEVRRARRRLEDDGARFRMSGLDQLDEDVAAFARLHHSRWEGRGGSRALNPRVEALLRRAGRELIPLGRFRLWSLEVGGRPVSSHLFVAGGGGQAYWLGGFDSAWAAQHPAIQVLVHAVGDGIARGDRWLELGPGPQRYKYRLSDSEEVLSSVTLSVPAG